MLFIVEQYDFPYSPAYLDAMMFDFLYWLEVANVWDHAGMWESR